MKLNNRLPLGARRGFSRWDVIISILVLALVASFVAPALQRRRGAPRKLQCLSNIRQIGTAFQAYASNTMGSLPPLSSTLHLTTANREGELEVGWPVILLPALDGSALFKNIKQNAVPSADPSKPDQFQIADSERFWMPNLTCPDDQLAERKPGGLSYSANAGFISQSLYSSDPNGLHRLDHLNWTNSDTKNDDHDILVSAATGVVWRHCVSFQPSLDNISAGDGQTSTLLLTENLQAGPWWATETPQLGFGIPVAEKNGRVIFGQGNFLESAAMPLNTEFPGSSLSSSASQNWRINKDLTADRGTLPRPSSQHAGGVNVIMCDGSGRFLSEKIDPHVYLRLITSNGTSFGEQPLSINSW